jgi:hypothetical protein
MHHHDIMCIAVRVCWVSAKMLGTLVVLVFFAGASLAFPPGTQIPTDSQCYYQNTTCANCTGYAHERCVWSLTQWPRIACWPAQYDSVQLRWVANTTAYVKLANATAPNPAPPMWTPVQDQFHCFWDNTTHTCGVDCAAKVENSDNQRNNGQTMVRYDRNELEIPPTYDPTDWSPQNWNSLGFNFYEVSMDGGSGDVSIGPPTCNFQISYGAKPVGVAQGDASIASHSFMLMFDSYFFYSSADYPTGWAPGGVLDPPIYNELLNLSIQGNLSVLRNGTVVNTVTLLPQNYAHTTNQFNMTCYWSPNAFYYDAAHYITPYTTKCDIQMANLTYPAGTDSVALRVVAMSSVEQQNYGPCDGSCNQPHQQSHTALGAGTFDWDPTIYLNGNTSLTATVFGHGPLDCGVFSWLTPTVREYLITHVNINPTNIKCNYFSFSTAGAPKFMWDPEIGLNLSASNPNDTTTTVLEPSDGNAGLTLGLILGLALGLPLLAGAVVWLYLSSRSSATPAYAKQPADDSADL